MKRALTIVAVLIVLIGIGIGIYFFFFSPNSPHLTVSNSPTLPGSDTRATTNTTTGAANVVGGAGIIYAPGLIQLTSQPVAAGEAVFDTTVDAAGAPATASSSASTTPAANATADVDARYIDRASGNVYDFLLYSRSLTRISNKTLPGIQLASWLADGSEAFVQFISNTSGAEHVETYALPATGQGGYFLQEDLSQASILASTTLFTLANGSNSSIGTIARADGSNPHTLFTSPLTSLQVQQAGAGYVAVTKAANSLNGYVFAVSGNTFTPILGPLRGLTALSSPNGSNILYSYTDGNNYRMSILDRSSGNVTPLPIATPTEKCVWTRDNQTIYCAIPTSIAGTEPDDWYQGAASFTDRIWRISLSSHIATLVTDLTQVKSGIDAVNLSVDPLGRALVFRNKKDGSLWAYTGL